MQLGREARCALLVLVAVTAHGRAADACGGMVIFDGGSWVFPLYRDEPLYVLFPAGVGAGIGGTAGLLASGVVLSPLAKIKPARRKSPNLVASLVWGQTTSMVTGAPFYATKRVAWDAPRQVVARLRQRAHSSEAAEPRASRPSE